MKSNNNRNHGLNESSNSTYQSRDKQKAGGSSRKLSLRAKALCVFLSVLLSVLLIPTQAVVFARENSGDLQAFADEVITSAGKAISDTAAAVGDSVQSAAESSNQSNTADSSNNNKSHNTEDNQTSNNADVAEQKSKQSESNNLKSNLEGITQNQEVIEKESSLIEENNDYVENSECNSTDPGIFDFSECGTTTIKQDTSTSYIYYADYPSTSKYAGLRFYGPSPYSVVSTNLSDSTLSSSGFNVQDNKFNSFSGSYASATCTCTGNYIKITPATDLKNIKVTIKMKKIGNYEGLFFDETYGNYVGISNSLSLGSSSILTETYISDTNSRTLTFAPSGGFKQNTVYYLFVRPSKTTNFWDSSLSTSCWGYSLTKLTMDAVGGNVTGTLPKTSRVHELDVSFSDGSKTYKPSGTVKTSTTGTSSFTIPAVPIGTKGKLTVSVKGRSDLTWTSKETSAMTTSGINFTQEQMQDALNTFFSKVTVTGTNETGKNENVSLKYDYYNKTFSVDNNASFSQEIPEIYINTEGLCTLLSTNESDDTWPVCVKYAGPIKADATIAFGEIGKNSALSLFLWDRQKHHP